MQVVTTIGFDIAKSVFQLHGVDAHGKVVVRRQLRRRYVLPFFKKLSPCLVGIEACATSNYWSRELQALGHTARLMPPVYVKPYLKRQKNDAADAEAICEAVVRPNMRFVATKTAEQQSCLMLHRTRHLFVRQQNAVINSIRAHLAELGVVAPVGRNGVEELLDVVADPDDDRVPEIARDCVAALGAELRMLKGQILEFDRRIMRGIDPMTSKRLDESASGPRWPPHSLPALPIPGLSDQDGTFRLGSGWCRSRPRAAARKSSAASPSVGIDICAACSLPARWRSFAMRRSTAPSTGPGSPRCCCGGRPRWLPSRSPTRSRAWPGP
jgi:transposase